MPANAWTTRDRVRFVAKPLVFALALLPLAVVALAAFGIGGRDLGVNPVETLMDHFGIWGLRFIVIALAVTPLRRLTGRNWLSLFRRMLGLFAAFYVTLHFAVYLVLDQGLALAPILEDIVKRPFITIGFAAVLLLWAMTATSTLAMRRRLGRRWQQLHNSVYIVGVLAVWHFWWQVKSDVTEPAIYAAIVAVLLGLRAYWYWQRRRQQRATAASARSAA